MLHRPKIYPFYEKKGVFFCKTTQKSVYKSPFCKNMFINHTNQAPQKIDIAKSALNLVNKHLQTSLADPLLHPFFPFGAAQKNYILYIESREDPMKDLDQTIVTGNKTIRFQPSEMRPHLVVLYPQSQFKQIALSVGSVILGRGSDADIHLDDELVSRKHCKISFDGLHITVEDLGSTNGTYVDGNAITTTILGPDNRLQLGTMVLKVEFKDATEEAIDRELFEAATTDALTKIANRRTFMDRSLGELALARRNNYYVHCIMVDIDHFKRVNDTWGHQCGDVVLKEVAKILKNEKRESDLLARYGGEEFVLLLCGIGPEDAKKSAERLRAAVENHRFSWNDTIIPVTISLGLASKQGEFIGKIDELIAESDKYLYIAKEDGRNQVASA